jgi:hypothetical protein
VHRDAGMRFHLTGPVAFLLHDGTLPQNQDRWTALSVVNRHFH